jgi:S-adenosylmethionine:tRNA ribosyltransferase-isomerase
MIPESRPVQRPPEARLLAIDAAGRMRHLPRADFVALLRRGDLVIANDAATLPASLHGAHLATGAAIELRLAGWPSPNLGDPRRFHAIVFGAGDYRQPTEDRSPPPALRPGDLLTLGPLSARIEALLGHPRLVALSFEGAPDAIWAGLARHGRPIQYAHVPAPLAIWDVWTPIAGPPVAFEPPSAGFALDWGSLAAMRARGIVFATLTHAAGISSTGDPALDNLLPFDEPYSIPAATASAIRAARVRGGRIIAIGTTVLRALEAAGSTNGVVRAGNGVATGRIGAGTKLRIVDALLTGAHEPGTSHHALMGAFLDETMLRLVDAELAANHYRTHEFGDSVLIERGVGLDGGPDGIHTPADCIAPATSGAAVHTPMRKRRGSLPAD